MTNCYQFVSIYGYEPDLVTINCGICQGSDP